MGTRDVVKRTGLWSEERSCQLDFSEVLVRRTVYCCKRNGEGEEEYGDSCRLEGVRGKNRKWIVRQLLADKDGSSPVCSTVRMICSSDNPDETLPEELLLELKSEGFPGIRVAQLKSTGDKRKLPLFLVEFHHAVDKNKVNGITNIFGMGVRVEPYKTPKTPLQCHNCQRLGHGAQCCSAERRCVKCGLNHLAKECNKTKEEFYCALCGENHTATYRGCLTYKNQTTAWQTSIGNDRQFRGKIDEIFSGWKPIKVGVPQGSLLGPTLFNLYVNNLPASPGIKVAMYADDTAFLAQSWKPSLVSNRLQGSLDKAESLFFKVEDESQPIKVCSPLLHQKIKT
ncbi:hypothetical protein AAG570_011514 [Ranatra chinensis]|uniref:Reverse transcriptase domain-containing protein n=1 Tax=Ranatra chinensis TaxID=642074 RepID=A0ABD0Z732_9HEMI